MRKKLKKIIIPLTLIIILVAGYFVFLDKDSALRASAGYLKLTETSDYFHVQSGVYGVRLSKITDADNYTRFYDGNSVRVAAKTYGLRLRVADGTTYRADFDTTARELSLIENNKSRVVIKMTGKFNSAYDSGGSNLSDGSDDVTYEAYYYIYPEYFTYKISINAYDGINLYNESYTGSNIMSITQSNHYFDSGELYHGTSTGEVLASNYSVYEEDNDYVAVLATSTPDWQVLKISDIHSGTTTLKLGMSTEATYQGFQYFYDAGNLKGISESVFAVRPKINTTAEDRLAFAQKMLALDASEFSVGASVNDLSDETYNAYTPDGTMHLAASNNKAEFTLHANATNTWATLSATSTGGAQTLSITNNQGLEDPNGASSSWAYLGNRKSYGSFDTTDPDVLFYWDMNSTTTGQAPNKGVGTVEVYGNFGVNKGVAGDSIGPPTTWDNIGIDYKNFNPIRGSIAFWYKDASSTNSQAHYPLYHGSNWADSGELRISRDDSGLIDINLNDIAVIHNYDTTEYVDLEDGQWHFLRINYEADEDLTELYIDGQFLTSSNTVFDPLELYADVRIFDVSGINFYYVLDELYISSDPDQPDAPSYYDVIKYTDISAGTLSGIPETGAGSMKWNHPIDSPIWQTQRQNPVFTIHDWSPRTRSTTTGEFVDHLVLDLPLDSVGINSNAGKVYDKVSGEWIGTVNQGVSFEQGKQGNAVAFPVGSIGAVNERLLLDEAENYIEGKGTIEFDFKYNGNGNYYGRFFSSNTNRFELRRRASVDELSFNINNIDTDFTLSTDINDYNWHHFRVLWDDESNLRQVYVDNTLELSTTTSFTMSIDGFMDELTLNSNPDGTYFNNGSFDNFRIYNNVILPYGAYYTGEPNDGHYAGAHPDITFYTGFEGSDDDERLLDRIGSATGTLTGSITTNSSEVVSGSGSVYSQCVSNAGAAYTLDTGVFNSSQGSISFWFQLATSSYSSRLLNLKDATDWDEYLYMEVDDDTVSGNTVRVQYNGSTYHITASTQPNIQVGQWHYVNLVWDTDYMKWYIDNELIAEGTDTRDAANDYLDNLSISLGQNNNCQFYIDEFYITNSPDTPQIPTAFGVPLVAPQLAITDESTDLLQIETDYDISPLNEIGTYLGTYHGTLLDDTTFVFTETLNPTLATDPAVPLHRIHPLLSTSYTSNYATITVQRGTGEYADDFKLIFSEADAGVSSCYLGQGSAGSWGDNLCSAASLLSEVDQNSVIQTDQTATLNLLQSGGTEAIIRNSFVLTGEATTTEEWHIFADGSVVIDRKYEKENANAESRSLNLEFSNYAYYPATPDTSRVAGVYHDSLFLSLTSVNTDKQNDYLSPVTGATSTFSGLSADLGVDINADGYAEARGAYSLGSNYAPDPSVPQCPGTCGQPIYHTIGTSSATVNVTVSTVDTISSELFIVKFSGSPDLSGIHKRDKLADSSANDWNIVSIDDTNDQLIVGDQEKNGGTPATGAGTVGPWYNSLSAWEAAEDRNLASTSRYPNGEIEMVECWSGEDNTEVEINGWTTAENNFLKVYTPLNKRHKGVLDENLHIIDINSTGNFALYVNDNYVQIDGLQVDMADADVAAIEVQGAIESGGSAIYISNNIIKGAPTPFDSGIFVHDLDLDYIYIYNNIIFDLSDGDGSSYDNGRGIYIRDIGEIAYVLNNTIANTSLAITKHGSNGELVLKNNLTIDCDTDYYTFDGGSFSSLSDYNISEDGSAPGGNSKTCTVSFVSTSTDDYHLASNDICAKGYGSPIFNFQFSISNDIDGEPRGNTWDIGADQIVNRYSNKFKIELDSSSQTMYQPRFLINDFYPQVGKRGSEEDFIVYHNDMSSVVDFHKDKVSGLTNDVVGSATTTVNGYRGGKQ